MGFTFQDIPDLTGKTAIVTGASQGIGKLCARELSRKNCQVILACRNEETTTPVVDAIRKETGNSRVNLIVLDLASLPSIKKFADTFTARYGQLHILINNAAIQDAPEYVATEDGLESMFAVNNVGHHYLTVLLLPLLKKSAPSRVVNVSSLAHKFTALITPNFEHMNDEKKFRRSTRYAASKAANILFTLELDKRLRANGINHILVNANHPGAARTQMYHSIIPENSFIDKFFGKYAFGTSETGAVTQLYLATSPEVEETDIHGKYYVHIAFSNGIVPPGKPGSVTSFCKSEDQAQKLWDIVENLLKEKAPGYAGAGL
ncbi:hypothetical protein BJV82DRAFT_641895 [Fennellomyces sp. T-0311]|nr:hypothetical protein BJV82DRAFT_641895 [Fennellomyces sp. T-0311]